MACSKGTSAIIGSKEIPLSMAILFSDTVLAPRNTSDLFFIFFYM